MLIDLLKKRPFWDFFALSKQPLDMDILPIVGPSLSGMQMASLF